MQPAAVGNPNLPANIKFYRIRKLDIQMHLIIARVTSVRREVNVFTLYIPFGGELYLTLILRWGGGGTYSQVL